MEPDIIKPKIWTESLKNLQKSSRIFKNLGMNVKQQQTRKIPQLEQEIGGGGRRGGGVGVGWGERIPKEACKNL